MAGVRLGENEKIQACVLQAAQELGYHSMKPAQVEIVLNFVKGQDVFAIQPTGFGKVYATHVYRLHLMALTRSHDSRGSNFSTCHHEGSGKERGRFDSSYSY